VKEDVNVQAEEKGNDFDVNNSLDPFKLYSLLNKKKNVKEKMDKSNGTVSILFPPGFTPCDETEVECDKKSMGNNEGSRSTKKMSKLEQFLMSKGLLGVNLNFSTLTLDRMPRSGIESEQWDHLLDSLEGVMLNPSEDRWSWDLNGLEEFSVASARRYIDNNRLPDISSKTRWIKEVPIKVNVHAWKVRINGLPTRWNISRRGIDIPSILCPLCETGVESSKHLFFNCSVVRAIFQRVCIWWDVSYMALDSFDEWIS
nr:RNA-directed DNA polymerase, eukaryota [Tanacetum cinerariifolium]